eukprot:CAMPEP_0167821828 /NCGR_PEP_ID=MMETSP0112_2-20121227/7059_1 /TAXON_ID=91324 /ORGANISM="Lotharella globosa, Strain CCCM811" /LENGTH=123 /DNA_ID=CAMNT_0007722931 /DNA_START=282 /DNA_END=653 /DNA_ORIENTATION=+
MLLCSFSQILGGGQRPRPMAGPVDLVRSVRQSGMQQYHRDDAEENKTKLLAAIDSVYDASTSSSGGRGGGEVAVEMKRVRRTSDWGGASVGTEEGGAPMPARGASGGGDGQASPVEIKVDVAG